MKILDKYTNFDITSDTGHVGQWYEGKCKTCGEVLRRTQGGDLDDWWFANFVDMLEDHVCNEDK